LKKADQLAAKVGHVFVATADAKGWSHVAAAGRLAVGSATDRQASGEERVTNGEDALEIDIQQYPQDSSNIWE